MRRMMVRSATKKTSLKHWITYFPLYPMLLRLYTYLQTVWPGVGKCGFVLVQRVSICRSIICDPAGIIVCVSLSIAPCVLFGVKIRRSLTSARRESPHPPLLGNRAFRQLVHRSRRRVFQNYGGGGTDYPLFKRRFHHLWYFGNLEWAAHVRVASEDVLT